MMLKSMGMGIVEFFALMNCVAGCRRQVSLGKNDVGFWSDRNEAFSPHPQKSAAHHFLKPGISGVFTYFS